MHNPEPRRRANTQARPNAAAGFTHQEPRANQVLSPHNTGAQPLTLRMRNLTLNERQRIPSAPRKQVAKAGESTDHPIINRRGENFATWLAH